MKISVAALLLLLLQIASAYEVETHVRFSQMAASCSVLKDQRVMENFGLQGLEDEDPLWRKPVDTQDKKSGKWISDWIVEYNKMIGKYKPTIKTLIGWGAKFEDEEFLARPLNHFFDPLNGQAFHPCPWGTDCNTSPDWALEDGLPQPNLNNQELSLFDANDRFRYAPGLADKDARETAWAGFFQSLGMVVHHVQDKGKLPHAGMAGDGRMEEHAETISWAMVIA